MLPKVSVLLPIYNASNCLHIAVESILEQTLTDFELILINDGSTDGSPQIMAHYAKQDDRIILISTPHQGIAHALNRGLEIAQAPFVARMDADDFSYATRLEKQYKMLENDPSLGLVGCLVNYGGEIDTQAGYARYVDWINGLVTWQDISLNRFIESPIAHPSVMFRASCVREFGGYKTSAVPEDYELWLRWMDRGIKMAKVPEVLFQWNDPPGRLSRIHPNYKDVAFASVKAEYLHRWLAKKNPYHPQIMIWGAGRKSRRRSDLLLAHGCEVTAYIDLKAAPPIHGIPVFPYTALPELAPGFLVSFVNNRGARDEIAVYLQKVGWKAGKDYLLC